MKKLTLVLLAVVLIYGNCTSAKETPEPANSFVLPDLTLAGKYTMACFIDNVAWKNAGSHTTPASWGTYAALPNLEASLIFSKQKDSTQIHINGNMYTTNRDDDLLLKFSCKGLPKPAEVYYNNSTPKVNLDVIYIPNGGGKTSPYDYTKEKFIINPKLDNSSNISFVKVDTINKIISGVFYAKIYSSQNTSSQNVPKTVFQGRFDVKYQPYPLNK
jgi:hypothetical protein